jgi:TrkA domain protein
MARIRDIALPGIGHKFEIDSRRGDKLVVIVHDDGTREIYRFSPVDPDQSLLMATLDDEESRQLAGIIGGLSYTPKALESAELALQDLVIEWYRLQAGSTLIGKTIGELEVRKKTGATIMAVVEKDRHKTINPGPEQRLQVETTLVVAGERQQVRAFKQLIEETG